MDARRLIPVGVVVTALLVLAGIASHGRPLQGGQGSGPSATFFDYVATTLFIVAVFTLVVVVWGLLMWKRDGGGPPKRTRGNLLAALLFFFMASLIAVGISRSEFQRRLQAVLDRTQSQQPQRQRKGATGRNPNVRNPHVRWDEIAVVALVVGGVLAFVLVRRPKKLPMRELLRRRVALSHVLDESLDDLRNEPDVRRAIIAAYARMERALGRAGIARFPAEAPFEYLARALGELETSAESARRLTHLFERAKFSHHEPDEAMRGEAIDALIAVRDELRGPQPAAAAA